MFPLLEAHDLAERKSLSRVRVLLDRAARETRYKLRD